MPESVAREIDQRLSTALTNQVTVAFVQLSSPLQAEKRTDATHPVTGRTTAAWTSVQVKEKRVARACAIIDALAALPNPPQLVVFSEYCVPLDSGTLATLHAKAVERQIIVVPGADNVDDGPVNYSYVVEPGREPWPVTKLRPSPDEYWLDPPSASGHAGFAWEFGGRKYYLAVRVCWDFASTNAEHLRGPVLVIVPMNSKDVFETHAKQLARGVTVGGAAFILCNAVGGKATGSSGAVGMLPEGDRIVAKLPAEQEACAVVRVNMDHLVAPKYGAHLTFRALEADRRFLIEEDGTMVRLDPLPNDASPSKAATVASEALTPPRTPGILAGADDARLVHDTHFVGRENEVARLCAPLQRPPDSLRERFIVVTGEAGLGKTELCKATLAAFLRGSQGARVLWVDATRAATPDEFVGRFAVALGRTTISKAADIVADLRTWPAIVYVDNLEDALSTGLARAANLSLLHELITASGKPILATSRETLQGQAQMVTLDPLASDDAVKVFVHAARNAGNETPPGDDAVLREFLKEDLGNHPLTLEVVGSHVGPGVAWMDVRRRWRRNFNALAAVPGGAELKNRNLKASIDLTFEKLQEGGGLSRRLWAFLAYFPEGVAPHRLAPILHADHEAINRASDLLCRHSVARRQAGALRVLPPMASFIRDAARGKKGDLNHLYFQTRLLDWFELLWHDVEANQGIDNKRGAALDMFLANMRPLLVLARDINANAAETGE